MMVYLCGTITADPATHEWRVDAMMALAKRGIKVRSPMRGKNVGSLSKDGLTSNIPPLLFTARDLRDIHKSDALLIYTLGIETLNRQSIGTWAEFGIAIERGIPIVFVATDPSVVNHPFVKKWASVVVPTLHEAVVWLDWLV